MLKADAKISRHLESLSANKTVMDWLSEQRTSIALSLATAQGVPLHWGQGHVQMLDDIIKTIKDAHKTR